MNHKKITIGCIAVATIFSFGILKPMDGSDIQKPKEKENKLLHPQYWTLEQKQGLLKILKDEVALRKATIGHIKNEKEKEKS